MVKEKKKVLTHYHQRSDRQRKRERDFFCIFMYLKIAQYRHQIELTTTRYDGDMETTDGLLDDQACKPDK